MRKSAITLVFAILIAACQKQAGVAPSTPNAPDGSTAAATTKAAPASPTPAPATSPDGRAVPASRGRTITIASGSDSTDGYLSVPPSEGDGKKHPALIVIHEWWGLDDWIRENTDHLADLGYVALAVDLYRAKSTNDPDVAHQLIRGLPEDRALRDMKNAFNLLAARGDVDPRKIAVMGWCMGGGYALNLATEEPRLAACVVNYGHLVTEPATIGRIHASIMGNFGGKDQGIAPQDVKTFQEALASAGVKNDIKIYDDTGHAFMNPGNKDGYNAPDARDAWGRIETFLATQLQP
jgi:carboxymethylenebutenolidase